MITHLGAGVSCFEGKRRWRRKRIAPGKPAKATRKKNSCNRETTKVKRVPPLKSRCSVTPIRIGNNKEKRVVWQLKRGSRKKGGVFVKTGVSRASRNEENKRKTA